MVRNRRWLALAFLLSCGLASLPRHAEAQAESAEPVPAGAPLIATSAFADRGRFTGVPKLAPNGEHIAYSLSGPEGTLIGVVDLDTNAIEHQFPIDAGRELDWLDWAGDDQILVSTSLRVPIPAFGIEIRIREIAAIDIEAGTKRLIAGGSDALVHVAQDGSFVLVSRPRNETTNEVWRIWLDGRDSEKVLSQRGVLRWFADDSGVVRVGLGVDGRRMKVWYREDETQTPRLIARVGRDNVEELWDVVRLFAGSDEGFVLEPAEDGKIALRRFNYATREIGEVVYENPDWDLEGFEVDSDGKPLAVHFTDDTPRVVWLDPDLARLQANLERALGARRGEVWIEAQSRSASRMLIGRTGANDPGAWYIYTPATRELIEFARVRPDLDPADLATGEAVEYTARDGTKIRAYLTLPRGRAARDLPLIVLVHGGPYDVRDTLSYSDEVQLLANRGYAVLQPNFRGSSGFGQEFEQLGRGEIGRRMQDDLDDAVDWASAQGLIDPQRVCLVGASYGGYAALWGVIRNPERYRCAASFAGVTEFDKQLEYDGDFLNRKGRQALRVLIRGDDRRFDLDSVSPAQQAARLQRPVLLVHGKRDNTVPFQQFELMQTAINRAGVSGAEFVALENSGHGFATAGDEQAWYDALIAFLARNNPAD